MAFQLTSSQEVDLSVRFSDRKGNPAQVQGPPLWQVDNPNVLALTPADDGLACTVSAVGPLGTATVSIQADADLGEGVKNLVGVFAVEVTGGEAQTVEIVPGAAREQP